MQNVSSNDEELRLKQAADRSLDWKLWGPYVSERAWGTVREDYSADGDAWAYFPFEHSHLRAYRWNEDGIAGICDRKQHVCLAMSFWNGQDAILKERLFGLSGPVGNHGEDIKEYHYYLDSTPTHSYMRFLYKYPQLPFPYTKLYSENSARDRSKPEFELIDTGVFNDGRYFDIFVEYAKADVEDICIRITAINRSSFASELTLVPTVWLRNTWSWDRKAVKPEMHETETDIDGVSMVSIKNEKNESYRLIAAGFDELAFTDNETNYERLYGSGKNLSPFVKDAFNEYIVHGDTKAVNPDRTGTKAAAIVCSKIEPGGQKVMHLRFSRVADNSPLEFSSVDDLVARNEKIFIDRKREADEFYATVIPSNLDADAKNIMRQAFAGMLWSKQYYHYEVENWLEGDPAFAPPPKERLKGRNSGWTHLYNDDVISMPDTWEYPWYASWDLAFHCIALALVDPQFAKRQLILFLREWYMHPNGQIPAYEWSFSDVNPPVHAWAALRVYKIEHKRTGIADRAFLEKVFHKLLLNFTWWVNRKDDEGNNVFEGGFLGLDNIGVFDRGKPLPNGGILEQSDGTSWMAMYCLNLLAIALELAKEDKVYEDVASKFFEHFVYISDAMNNLGEKATELWNERDGFYYDVLHVQGEQFPIKLRSLVGLIPLFAVETLEAEWLEDLPDFHRRVTWFLENRPDLTDTIACMQSPGRNGRLLMALVNKERLSRVLTTMLSEDEFLSDHGIRSLSKFHKECPYFLMINDNEHRVDYEPGESTSGMFGGNSNWRGPIWFPVNFLLIESLQKFDFYYGNDFTVEFPTGSDKRLNLWEVSQELEKRLCSIFLKDSNGRRATYAEVEAFQTDPNWKDNLLFHEYFHGDSGKGLGACHQTGWTGLIAKLLQQLGEYSIIEAVSEEE